MSEIIDGYVADVMKGKINISTPIPITADDVMEIAENMKNNRMMDEKTEIKDKLLNIFQKNYCMMCGSQRCAGDLREGCSYYRSYIDKIKEVYDDMKGEIE